jgi:hypothetical protein
VSPNQPAQQRRASASLRSAAQAPFVAVVGRRGRFLVAEPLFERGEIAPVRVDRLRSSNALARLRLDR